MKNSQWIVVAVVAVVFCFFYFGMDTKPSEQRQQEKTRALQMEATGIQNLLMEAKSDLDAEQKAVLDQLVEDVRSAEGDEGKLAESYKKLSGAWYQAGRADIAGYYAEEVAKRDSVADGWAIAGTTYMLAVQSQMGDKVTEWSINRARQAFENAISMDASNVDHKINLALTYIENPLGGAPMKGIMMLRDLVTANPDEVKALNQLGRLSLRTNQNDKAVIRLEHAIGVEPNNLTTICLLAQAYEAVGDKAGAEEYSARCKAK